MLMSDVKNNNRFAILNAGNIEKGVYSPEVIDAGFDDLFWRARLSEVYLEEPKGLPSERRQMFWVPRDVATEHLGISCQQGQRCGKSNARRYACYNHDLRDIVLSEMSYFW